MIYDIGAPIIIKGYTTQLNGDLQSILVYYVSNVHPDNTYEAVGILNTRSIVGSIKEEDIVLATRDEELASLKATLEIFNRHRSFYKDCGLNTTYMENIIISLERMIDDFIYNE